MSRFDYVKYDDEAMGLQETAKVNATALETTIENLKPGRAKALALTKLEECYMWIGKAIRDEQIARGGSDEHLPERDSN